MDNFESHGEYGLMNSKFRKHQVKVDTFLKRARLGSYRTTKDTADRRVANKAARKARRISRKK